MSYRILLFRFHSVPINLLFLRIINIDGLDCAILLHHDFSDYIYVYGANPFQLNDGRMTKANKKTINKTRGRSPGVVDNSHAEAGF